MRTKFWKGSLELKKCNKKLSINIKADSNHVSKGEDLNKRNNRSSLADEPKKSIR